MVSDLETRIRHVTAVLGPTNTGKTHLAIERMVGHQSGMIGLPLRLLAREVYDKICKRVGVGNVALITGEEKIKPERARYWVSTVEAMPRDIDVDFLAIDEVQLASDPDRGHVFTDRLLNARGQSETLLLGSQTMRGAISELIPGANFITRPRLSKLTYSGEKKITRLPTRSAIVAFSASEVYAIAELVRRQRGGAAVVLGALSPRTRNAQVELYQSGDVDFLIATDAVGMGLNLDVDHVAFSAKSKFDGQNHRGLTPSELGQIAGRAGRHLNDGTFGVTGRADAFDPELIEQLETHTFEECRLLQWRNRKLDFTTLGHLQESLKQMPDEPRLVRARSADDVIALESVCRDPEVTDKAIAPAAVAKLWDVCQIPDYRKISAQAHAELVGKVYKYLLGPNERIPEDWFSQQVAFADRTDGDIDTLATRLAHIRTWTFVSNRADWLEDPGHWQQRTREIEDTLSDAMHERLTQRFVDKRTSALMKGMRDKDELTAEIADDGAIQVEEHFVGRIRGFRYTPDAEGEGIHGRAARNAAAQVLVGEISMRCRRVSAAKTKDIVLRRDGHVMWRDEEIGRVEAGDDLLTPLVRVLSDEHMSSPDKERVQTRLDSWIKEIIAERLKPLVELSQAEDVEGLARGIAFQLKENLGVLKRDSVANDIKALDQTARAQLRKYGVRFGAFNVYFPLLLKPAAAELSATLWALKQASGEPGFDFNALPELPRAGLTSVAAPENVNEDYYRAFGYHLCGPRAVRLDILERLADLIRPLLAWRRDKAVQAAEPPLGATGEGAFKVTPDMMSILGCSPEELGHVLKTLGFHAERRKVKSPDDKTSTGVKTEAEVPSGPHAIPSTDKIETETQVSQTRTEDGPQSPESQSQEGGAASPVAISDEAQLSEPNTAAETTQASCDDVDKDKSAPPEEQYEEIWRPKRRNRGGHNRRPNSRVRKSGEGSDKTVEAGGDRDGAANGKQIHRGKKSAGAGAKSASDGQGARGRRRQSADNKGKKSWRDDKRAEAGGGGRGPKVHQSGPDKKGRKGPDPDSPFAALGALKESLGKKKEGQSS
ncbi:MAG: helicase-related protein [Hyphomicrobiaceae bacterium]